MNVLKLNEIGPSIYRYYKERSIDAGTYRDRDGVEKPKRVYTAVRTTEHIAEMLQKIKDQSAQFLQIIASGWRNVGGLSQFIESVCRINPEYEFKELDLVWLEGVDRNTSEPFFMTGMTAMITKDVLMKMLGV